MGYITPAHVVTLVINMIDQYYALLGNDTLEIGAGDGTFGASAVGDVIKDIVNGVDDATFRDADLQMALNEVASSINASSTAYVLIAEIQRNLFVAIDSLCARNVWKDATIISLDSFMNYCNLNGWDGTTATAAKKYTFQFTKEWWDLYNAIVGGTFRPSPATVCPMEVMLANGSGGLASFTFGNPNWTFAEVNSPIVHFDGTTPEHTFTGGVTDGAGIIRYVGGWPTLKWINMADGAGAITITVTGLNQAAVSKNWEFAGTWGAGNWTLGGTTAIPHTGGSHSAGDVLASVTGVSGSGLGFTSLTAGKIVVESRTSAADTVPYPSTVRYVE